MKTIIRSLILLLIASYSMSAQSSKYTVDKIYAEGVRFNGFSTVFNETIYFTEEAKKDAMNINKVRSFTLPGAKISTMELSKGISPMRFVVSNGEKFIITTDNKLYRNNAGNYENVKLPIMSNPLWDVEYVNNELYIFPLMGDVFLSSNMGESWEKAHLLSSEGAPFSNISYNNNLFIGKSDTLIYREGGSLTYKVLDPVNEKKDIIEGMATNGTDLFFYTSNNNIFKFKNGNFELLSVATDLDVCGLSVAENEDMVILTDYAIYRKLNNSNDYTPLHTFPKRIFQLASLKKENLLVKSSGGYAVIMPDYVLVSDNNANTWTKAIASLEVESISKIIKAGDMIAASISNGVFLGNSNEKYWYEVAGIAPLDKISNVIENNGETFAVGIKNVYSLAKSGNAWNSVLTSKDDIRASAMINNDIYLITSEGLYKGTVGSNELTLIDKKITEGKLLTDGNVYLIKDGIVTTLNKKEEPFDLKNKGIIIYDVATLNGVLYGATNRGVLMLQGGSHYKLIGLGITPKGFKFVKSNGTRLYLIDDDENVFVTNSVLSRSIQIKTNFDYKVNYVAGTDKEMYLATNKGAYSISNISDDIFTITTYWVNMGNYYQHSSEFKKLIVPDYHSLADNFSFVTNDKESRMMTISSLTGEVLATSDLTTLGASVSANTEIRYFLSQKNHLGDFTSFMYAPTGKAVQDSIFTLKDGSVSLLKKLNLEGITSASTLNKADFIAADGKVLYYHSYQVNPQDAKSVKNEVFYGTSYNKTIALNDFLNGYPGVISKVKYFPSDAENNSRLFVARYNNNPSAPADEKAMVSILNENGTKILKDIKLADANPINAMEYLYAKVDNKTAEVLAYSTAQTGEISDADAIRFYDITNGKKLFSFKGMRVYDMKAIDINKVATLVSQKESGKLVHKLLLIDVDRRKFVHTTYIEEAFFGKMTIDNNNKIVIFGNDGIIRKFENVLDAETLNASFYAEQTAVKVGEKVKFISTSTGTPDSYKYEFGDGTSSDLSNPEHAYATPGKYTVTLTITKDGKTAVERKVDYIKVVEEVGEFDFTASEFEGFAPFAVAFTETGTDNATERTWNFGDGETSNLKNPQHTYKKAGRYDVSLTISTGAAPKTVTKYYYIIVDDEPANYQAKFTAERTSGVAPFTVNFYDQTEGGAVERLWDFGDGNTSNEKHPTHIYRECGSYTVSLFVKKDGLQSKTTKERYISVNRGYISGLYIKDEIELIDTNANVMAMDLVRNADNSTITFDVRHEVIADGKLIGKIAVFAPKKTDEKAPINFYTLQEAFYNKGLIKFITPMQNNEFQYVSQYKVGDNDNFTVYNADLSGNFKNLVQKYEMKLNMAPVAIANFEGNVVGATVLNDSSLVLTFVSKDGKANMKEVFAKKPISRNRLPIMQLKDKNYLILYKPEGENLQYLVFDKDLNFVKTATLFDNVLYYAVDAYLDADANLIVAGEKKFNSELEPIANYLAKVDPNFNTVFDKEFTSTFKITGITELIRRWNQKSYVCSGQIEGHCAIVGFSAEGDITMKNKLANRKGILNKVVRVNDNELVFAGTIYSNVAERLNFYALHLHEENSYSDVEDSEVDNSLKIYPNPSNGLISTNDIQIYSMKVFDQAGKVVFEVGNTAESMFDLSFLNNGFYTLVINTPNGAKVGKLIIAK